MTSFLTTRQNAAGRRPGDLTRLGLPIALILVLQVTFIPYYAGWAIPPLDFLSSYTTDAYAWWSPGSILDPPEWLPRQWSGYPAAMSIQSGSWYAPVGLASALAAYTPHVAAVVQGLHAGWGALGGYVLARRSGLGLWPAALVLTAYFFAPGFFNGAAHPDLVRGWAWLPWLMLICSPLWAWERRSGVAVAAVMLWQALVGIYPGQIVAFCYALVVWTCCWLITMSSSRRAFLLRLSTSGLLGLALATPKYLPLVWLHSREFSSVDTMAAGLTTLASVVLPPEGLSGSNDYSMSAFYIPAALLIFLPVMDRGAQCFWPSLGALGTAVVLGLPFLPTYRLPLPGLALSRFQMNDFRAVFILSMILLGATGAQRAMTTREPLARRLFVAAAVVVGSTAWLALTTSAIHGGAGLVVAATAGAAACAAPFLAARRLISPLTGWFILIGSVAFSGGTFALLSVSDWGNDRVRTEVFHYGQTAETLVARAAEEPVDRRPPRWLPPAKSKAGLQEPLLDTAGNAAVYAHQYAAYGYSNLRNSDTVAAMTAAYHHPAKRESFLTFYGAPGAIAPVSKDTIGPMDSSCLASGSCAGLHFESTRYEAGEMTFSVLSDTAGEIAVNEAYYPGWHARVCVTGRGSECREAPVRRGPMGSIVLPVPRGASSFTLTYTTPGLDMGRVIFWVGLAGIALTLVVPRRRDESRYAAMGATRRTGSRSASAD